MYVSGCGGAAHQAAHEDHRGDGGQRGRSHAQKQQEHTHTK